jgi:hypothetical protein
MFGSGVVVAVVSSAGAINNAARSAVGGMGAASSTAFEQGLSIGSALARGVVAGINAQRAAVERAASAMAAAAAASARRTLGVTSPSKVFAEIGENMAKGMQLGFGRELNLPIPAAAAAGDGKVTALNMNVTVNMGNGDPAAATKAGRLLAESAQRTLVRRGVVSRVRTGG